MHLDSLLADASNFTKTYFQRPSPGDWRRFFVLRELVVVLPFLPCGGIEEGVGGVVSDELLFRGIELEVGIEILRDGAEGEDLGELGADTEGGVGGSFALAGGDEGGEVIVF